MSAWTIPAIREALAAKKISARELAGEFYAAHRETQSRTECLSHPFPRPRLRPSRPRGRRIAKSGDSLAPLAGVPIAMKDVISTQRRAHHLRLEDPRKLHPALRRDRRRAPRTRRRRHSRQNQLRRIRHGQLQRKLRLRSGTEPRGPRSRPRRLERRLRRGRRRRPGRRRAWAPTRAAPFASPAPAAASPR